MSRSLSRVQAIVLGLVVLAALTLGGWAVFQIGSRQRLFSETYELRAGFIQAHGLDRGTPVRVRGIDAGQVIAVELPPANDPNGKVYVRLRLDRKFQPLIPTDSKARVLNEGVLGGRLINIEPGKEREARLADGDEIAAIEAQELADIMAEASKTLQEIRDSNGTLAKLLKSDEAHKEMVQLVKDTQQMVKRGEATFAETQATMREGKDALTAIKQDAEAFKKLPFIRGYIEDSHALLYRPDQNADRRPFAAEHLFEPGLAVLTGEGQEHLNKLGPWLEVGKVKNSELVVVSYADPAGSSDLPSQSAQTLTLKRSEVVANYLRENLRAHRMSWVSSRNVIPLGMGHNPPPIPEKEAMSPNRTEIWLFTPR